MKRPRHGTVRLRGRLMRALNARLENAEDLESIREYQREVDAGTLVTYSADEVYVDHCICYVNRFRTRRLRKKYEWFFSAFEAQKRKGKVRLRD